MEPSPRVHRRSEMTGPTLTSSRHCCLLSRHIYSRRHIARKRAFTPPAIASRWSKYFATAPARRRETAMSSAVSFRRLISKRSYVLSLRASFTSSCTLCQSSFVALSRLPRAERRVLRFGGGQDAVKGLLVAAAVAHLL